ncbi:MAG: hypothetical protein Q4G09_04745 [Clostridia bacterium]|nr:hypothetical protein [Clostridia bacterium]
MENNQINIVNTITQTINNLFSNLFSSVDNSLYSVLDDLLFISSDIFNDSYLGKILGTSSSNGLILICNSLLIGLTLYYLCTLMLSYFTFSQVQRPSQFIFKLFLCAIAINFSEFLVEKIVILFSNISLSIREVGELVFNKSICLSTFIQETNSTIYIEETGFNMFSLNGLIKGVISIGLLNLTCSYAIRYIMLKVFIFLTPFAFVTLINSSTSWIFKSWFKLFMSLLVLQIFVPLILIVSFSIEINSSDMFSKAIYVGCIYSLIKCNSFVKDFMGGLSTDINIGISNLKNSVIK